jgi:hypothetical protein
MVNLADVLTLPAFMDTPTTMLPTADSSNGNGNSDSDSDSDRDGDSSCGGELTAEASTTNKQSAPSILLAQRRVATRSQVVTELRRSARRGKEL